ncbi:hypothetical protein K1719_032301 [Acacia pycnantha]|nr:hypothetical protein K1719_032301 [Acacia pycnantha]
MYVTRRLSLYLKDEVALTLPPPERNSGYLVIYDAESETLLRLRRDNNDRIRRLPLFQNEDFTVKASDGEDYSVLFIPVLNQPLSHNRYYVMWRNSSTRGDAATSSKEDDVTVNCCGVSYIPEASPRPLNPFDSYQQFEIIQKPRDLFEAKSMASDGVPPLCLREQWKLHISNTLCPPYHEALGLNSSLRAQLPHFEFLSSHDHSEPVVVGKWYCPNMFVRDKGKKTRFYEMTLEQKWFKLDWQKLVENDAFRDERNLASGFVKFISPDQRRPEVVELSTVIMERIKWEQESVGWVRGTNNGTEKLLRVEEFEGSATWRKFSCYLLVESFVLKRKDKSLVITFDFNHIHQVRCKWE